MRRATWLIVGTLGLASIAPASLSQPLAGIAPPILKAALDQAAAHPEARPVDPQAGAVHWGGDLERFIDQASGRSWKRRGSELQVGYQQRDFAPQTPGYETRGYQPMLKDAPDMMGVSIRLRTR